MEDILAIVLIFGGGTVVALAMSPIGRAIAARIQGRVPGANSVEDIRALRESNDALAGEIDQLRGDISELQERVDFAERVFAKRRDDGALPPGGSVQQ